VPSSWSTNRSQTAFDFVVSQAESGCAEGLRCVRIERSSREIVPAYGSLTQTVAAETYTRKRLRFAVSIRTSFTTPESRAYVSLRGNRAEKYGPPLSLLSPPLVTRAWRRHEVLLDVSSDVSSVTFGISMVGAGVVWIDDVTVSVADEMGR